MKEWAEQFYNSSAWKDSREAYMQSKGHLCERCSTESDPVVAKIVHHKIPLSRRNINVPEIALAFANLEALCQNCHNIEHHAGRRAARYKFDAAGNLLPPPRAATLPPPVGGGQRGAKTPSASNNFTPRRAQGGG